ncbi:Similar to bacterial dephospho-CoA kinase [Phaffia rhodozyma]|uniref:Similar to bacterial dephospho-CoA kinase n=1 Tax=Phaffia rhodozyma TaxID=264483 RepID=A0A0F7SXB2_PHARH|nr:Similar to bacterial dephospho-CoA kinase [Phaffia rhodozyma]
MLVVGLTGGIASGKSTVSGLLKTKHHIPIIDADVIAREVLEPGTSCHKAVVAHFGSSILLPSSDRIDRTALGSLIFKSPTDRAFLNSVTHPAVRREMLRQLIKYWLKGKRMVVLDVPLLIEAKLDRFVGEVVVVYVDEDVQLERLMKREPIPPNKPLTLEQAKDRIQSQLPLKEKISKADHILDNSTTPSSLSTSVDALVVTLLEKSGKFPSWRLCWIFPPLGLWLACWRVGRKWMNARNREAKL